MKQIPLHVLAGLPNPRKDKFATSYKTIRDRINKVNEQQQKFWDTLRPGRPVSNGYYIIRSWQKQLQWIAEDAGARSLEDLLGKYNIRIPDQLKYEYSPIGG